MWQLCTSAVLGFILCCSGFGCGGGSPAGTPSPSAEVSSIDQVKERLKYVSETGQTGSSLAGLDTEINKLSDEGKKKALLSDYQKLMQMNNPAQAKSLAQTMLGKL